jgi:uncharacterized membrane protein YadS
MFAYPLLPGLLHLDPHGFGLWAGTSIHEIAQIVAVAFQDGQKAGEFGTIAKLSRVMPLAPMVIAIGWGARGSKSRKSDLDTSSDRPPIPWFVIGFVALVAVNSLITIPADAKACIVAGTTFLLSVALAAMVWKQTSASWRRKELGPLCSVDWASCSSRASASR